MLQVEVGRLVASTKPASSLGGQTLPGHLAVDVPGRGLSHWRGKLSTSDQRQQVVKPAILGVLIDGNQPVGHSRGRFLFSVFQADSTVGQADDFPGWDREHPHAAAAALHATTTTATRHTATRGLTATSAAATLLSPTASAGR